MQDLNAIDGMCGYNRREQTTLVMNWILNCDDDEAEQVREAFRLRFENQRQNAKLAFRVGDRVRFTRKSGQVIRGTVAKRLRKNISVRSDTGQMWRVGPTLLELDA